MTQLEQDIQTVREKYPTAQMEFDDAEVSIFIAVRLSDTHVVSDDAWHDAAERIRKEGK